MNGALPITAHAEFVSTSLNSMMDFLRTVHQSLTGQQTLLRALKQFLSEQNCLSQEAAATFAAIEGAQSGDIHWIYLFLRAKEAMQRLEKEACCTGKYGAWNAMRISQN